MVTLPWTQALLAPPRSTALLTLAAWPRPHEDPRTGPGGVDVPATWLPAAWVAVWVGGAVLQVLPGQVGAGGRATQ